MMNSEEHKLHNSTAKLATLDYETDYNRLCFMAQRKRLDKRRTTEGLQFESRQREEWFRPDSVQTGYGTHLCSYPMGTENAFAEDKAAGS
jgi:hypothetical protein